jgi:hypothetical protein
MDSQPTDATRKKYERQGIDLAHAGDVLGWAADLVAGRDAVL